jgi:hypothetical protein
MVQHCRAAVPGETVVESGWEEKDQNLEIKVEGRPGGRLVLYK